MSTPWRSQPVKTLLVDLDGTLLGSIDRAVRLEFVSRALWRIRRYNGLRAAVRSLEAIQIALESPAFEDRQMLNSERAARAFGRETGLSFEKADQVLRQEVGAIFPLLKRYFYPVVGAREFIVWAQPRYRLILATNPVWPLEQVLLRLKWAGISPDVFASITHSDRMHACKPSEDYYRELLEQEDLKPQECALVGDDVRKDLPATRVGISVFILSKQSKAGLEEGTVLAQSVSGGYGELRGLLS